MDLQKLLEKANENYAQLDAKFKELDTKYTALVEAGEKNADQHETIKTLQNEIADLQEKAKRTVHAQSTEGKSVRDVANQIIGKYLKQAGAAKDGTMEKNFATFARAEVKAALNLTNTGEGLESVDQVLSRQIIERAREAFPMLGEIGRRNMPRNLREEVLLSMPSVKEGIENVAGVEISETEVQRYGEVFNKVAKLKAKPRITDEAMHGSDLDLYSHLLTLVDEEIGRYLLNQCLFGNGTGKNMRGVLSSNRCDDTEGAKETYGATPRDLDHFPIYKTGVADGLPSDSEALADWVIDVVNELPTKYLKSAKFYMTRKTAKVFRKARDADGKKLLVSVATGGFTLEGFPVVIDDTMPELAAGSTPIIFGALAQAFTISDGDINKMLLDPYTVDGCTVVNIDQEFFEMVGKNDAIVIVKCKL